MNYRVTTELKTRRIRQEYPQSNQEPRPTISKQESESTNTSIRYLR